MKNNNFIDNLPVFLLYDLYHINQGGKGGAKTL